MSTEELEMTKWNGSVPQIHVPDITPVVLEYHMSPILTVMSIIMIIIMFVVSSLFWYSCISGRIRLHRAMYALAALFSSFVAGVLIVRVVTCW